MSDVTQGEQDAQQQGQVAETDAAAAIETAETHAEETASTEAAGDEQGEAGPGTVVDKLRIEFNAEAAKALMDEITDLLRDYRNEIEERLQQIGEAVKSSDAGQIKTALDDLAARVTKMEMQLRHM